MLRDHLIEGGLNAHVLEFLECFGPALRGVVRLRWDGVKETYQKVHGFPDFLEVIERLDGSGDGLRPFPDDAIAVEEENANALEDGRIVPSQALLDEMRAGLH